MQSGQAGARRAKAEALRTAAVHGAGRRHGEAGRNRTETRRGSEGLKIKVGSRVKMAKTNAPATVRYVGPVDYASGTFVGLEFDPPDVDGPVYGKHSGIVRGREYFDCPPGMGVMVQPSEVVSEDLPSAKTAAAGPDGGDFVSVRQERAQARVKESRRGASVRHVTREVTEVEQ